MMNYNEHVKIASRFTSMKLQEFGCLEYGSMCSTFYYRWTIESDVSKTCYPHHLSIISGRSLVVIHWKPDCGIGLGGRKRDGHGEAQAKRIIGLVADASQAVGVKSAVLESVVLQNLVVTKVEGELHLLEARLGFVVLTKLATGLAAHEMRDEGLGIASLARVALGHHLLVVIHQVDPVPVQTIVILEIHLTRPLLLRGCQQVDERALIICLEFQRAI